MIWYGNKRLLIVQPDTVHSNIVRNNDSANKLYCACNPLYKRLNDNLFRSTIRNKLNYNKII